ncbi:MAG TPA: efflux RND transporter periplasmic adaptor subunit [Gemmatimonadaceae bacterium]|nr:efflux RND transporter periplasmic adaptor subunit [Gemmatimonadaceae bacterium]
MHLRTISVLTVGLLLAACSDDNEGGLPEANARPVTPSGAPTPANGGAGLTTGANSVTPASGAPGGRPSPTVTLAAGDIGVVRRDTIEEGIAITGDLNPIESVEVRARIEGDLVGVYVREGQQVRVGQQLARFESSEQESAHTSAQADRVAAESELATAQWNLEQTTELYRAGAVSEMDFKSAQQSVITARARVAATQSRVRAAASLLRDTRVLAPTTGIIARRLVENGEHLARGAGLFTLVRSDALELTAAVPARQANAVRVGQTVHFVADGRSFDGKVARVSPTVDPTTRSVAVFVQVPNANGALKGGTFATGRVVSRVVSGALVVPMSAVRQSSDNGRPFVYRINGQTLDIATVQLGVVDERSGVAEVLDGLQAGDRVIVGNLGTLGRGMQVIIAGGGEERRGGQR